MAIWDFAKRAVYNLVTSATKKEIDKLIEILKQYPLVRWDGDEVDQISRSRVKRKIKRVPGYVKHGAFQSIYHETIMAFALKENKGIGRELLVIRINNNYCRGVI